MTGNINMNGRYLLNIGQSGAPADAATVGFPIAGLAAQLQKEGAASFVKSWQDLLQSIETKSKALG